MTFAFALAAWVVSLSDSNRSTTLSFLCFLAMLSSCST